MHSAPTDAVEFVSTAASGAVAAVQAASVAAAAAAAAATRMLETEGAARAAAADRRDPLLKPRAANGARLRQPRFDCRAGR